MPNIAEFLLVEEYLQNFQRNHHQQHLKFCFSDNDPLVFEMINYLSTQGYGQGLTELYGIHPEWFPKIRESSIIQVLPVTRELLPDYLAFEYELDAPYGTAFAAQKQLLYKKVFHDNRMLQLLAFYAGEPAGAVDVILSEKTVELDNFVVLESYRNKGIGTRLQQFVMNQFADKYVILAADGYDTAREMYQKQNYQYLGFRYEVLKVNS